MSDGRGSPVRAVGRAPRPAGRGARSRGAVRRPPRPVPELKALIARYLDVSGSLDGLRPRRPGGAAAPPAPLPEFDGFRTIERIGSGGMGEVYKLQDLTLDRLVAAKVIRSDRGAAAALAGFLARGPRDGALPDRRIVQIHECATGRPARAHHGVRGRFRAGPSGAVARGAQRARIMKDVCEAVSTRTTSACSTATSSRRTSCSTPNCARGSSTSA